MAVCMRMKGNIRTFDGNDRLHAKITSPLPIGTYMFFSRKLSRAMIYLSNSVKDKTNTREFCNLFSFVANGMCMTYFHCYADTPCGKHFQWPIKVRSNSQGNATSWMNVNKSAYNSLIANQNNRQRLQGTPFIICVYQWHAVLGAWKKDRVCSIIQCIVNFVVYVEHPKDKL